MGKRGRPRLATGPTAQVTVYLPAREFDALCKSAIREGVSVPEIIRRKIRQPTPFITLKNRRA